MSRVWQELAFADAVTEASAGSIKTPLNEVAARGLYPVVDQGRALISGYVNDDSRLCHADLPAIVFGDHTRVFKYIDFPFCIGAEGVKVLRPGDGVDAKYLYHYLRQVQLPHGGYDRHFKYLKQITVPVPTWPEQRRIADILDAAEGLRAKRREALGAATGLATSLFLETFGDPANNPHRYPVRSLLDLVDPSRPITYGILKPGPDHPEGMRYIRVVDMKDGGIALGGLRRTSPAISNAYRRSLLKGGDLLLSIRGHVGRLALVPDVLEGANITQDTARLAIRDVSPIYVLECLRTPSYARWMVRHTKGVAVTGINLGDVKRMPIPVPPVEAQHAFANRLTKVSRLSHLARMSLGQINVLVASLQHRAFRGEL